MPEIPPTDTDTPCIVAGDAAEASPDKPLTVAKYTLHVVSKGNFITWLFAGIILIFVLSIRDHVFFHVSKCNLFQIDQYNAPHFILLWALVFTSFYTYKYLLIETIKNAHKTFAGGSRVVSWFHRLFLITVLFSAYVAYTNYSALLHFDCKLSEPPPTDASSLPNGLLLFILNILHFSAHSLETFHLLILVIFWSSLDILIASNSVLEEEKIFFRLVFCAVDLPVIFSMIFVEVIVHICLSGVQALSLDYLRAGVVAFQLMMGGIAICMMEGMRPITTSNPTVEVNTRHRRWTLPTFLRNR